MIIVIVIVHGTVRRIHQRSNVFLDKRDVLKQQHKQLRVCGCVTLPTHASASLWTFSHPQSEDPKRCPHQGTLMKKSTPQLPITDLFFRTVTCANWKTICNHFICSSFIRLRNCVWYTVTTWCTLFFYPLRSVAAISSLVGFRKHTLVKFRGNCWMCAERCFWRLREV